MGSRSEGGRYDGIPRIIEGVLLSYLPTTFEGSISAILDENPAATCSRDLPIRPVRDFPIWEFDRHFYTLCILPHPTIERVLEMGPRQSPSVVELFTAATATYYGLRQAFLSPAPSNTIGAERFDITPVDLLGALRTMHSSFAGLVDLTVLPSVSYIALLAWRRGVLVVAPRFSWPSGANATFPPAWGSSYNHRRHVPRDLSFGDCRGSSLHIESFSSWLANRALVLAGPSSPLSAHTADCFPRPLRYDGPLSALLRSNGFAPPDIIIGIPPLW